MSGRDLGTYHLRVEFADGRGWIDQWRTGPRYTNGSAEHSPLTAMRITPTYDAEADLFQNMVYMYTDGNYSCDCNRTLFWCRSQQLEEPAEDAITCGDTWQLMRLTAIRPDGSEALLWP
jgi:hypothetical protein